MPYRHAAHISLLALLLLVTAAAYVPQVVFSDFKVEAQGSVVTVKWMTQVEDDVTKFTLERQTRFEPENVWKPVPKEFKAHGKSKWYEYKDESVYKTTADEVKYRIRTTFRDGSVDVTESVSTNYTTSAIRRTWGSIKAMFQ